MAIINGTPVVFGFPTTTDGITITGVTGTLLQSAENSVEAENDVVRDNIGNKAARTWYDQYSKATLEWIVKGSSLAAAITNQALASLTPGTIITISACAARPDLIATTWEVMSGAKCSSSNTTHAKISVSLEKCAGITAVAT